MQIEGDAERFFARVHNSHVALFLDFDGVLAAIAPTPDAVHLDDAARRALLALHLAAGGALAIVSGRSLSEIDRLVGTRLPVAGDHGNERRRADGSVTWLNRDALKLSGELAARVGASIAGDSRLIVERKPSAVALHYRLAPERAAECDAILAAAVDSDPTWSVIKGKMVVEARARGADKGAAVRAYLAEPPFWGRLPVVLGDDVTDEDGFAVAEAMGGVGIKVGPGQTAASLRIPDQKAVLPFLQDLAPRLGGGA